MIAWLFTAWGADCDLRAFDTNLQRFDEAFVELNLGAFQEAVSAQKVTITCMQEALTPVHAVAIHRMRAIDAFVSDDATAATLYFQALVATRPGYTLPADVVPAGHPLQAIFQQAREYQDDSLLTLETPSEGWVTVDGRRTQEAPSGRPWVFQRFEADGSVAQTRYVEVGAPLPTYDTAGTGRRAGSGHKGRVPVLVTGLGLVAVGGGLYAGAVASRGGYDKAVIAGDKTKIDAGHARTNALAITSFVVGGLGLGTVGVSFAF